MGTRQELIDLLKDWISVSQKFDPASLYAPLLMLRYQVLFIDDTKKVIHSETSRSNEMSVRLPIHKIRKNKKTES